MSVSAIFVKIVGAIIILLGLALLFAVVVGGLALTLAAALNFFGGLLLIGIGIYIVYGGTLTA